MTNFGSTGRFEDKYQQRNNFEQNLIDHEDQIMEQILKSINTTPIGQILKRIASLPDVRQKKVLNVRRQLTQGEYDVEERLDIALDKILEDLII